MHNIMALNIALKRNLSLYFIFIYYILFILYYEYEINIFIIKFYESKSIPRDSTCLYVISREKAEDGSENNPYKSCQHCTLISPSALNEQVYTPNT